MADVDLSKMDSPANETQAELETIREDPPKGVNAIEDWIKNRYQQLGMSDLEKFLSIDGPNQINTQTNLEIVLSGIRLYSDSPSTSLDAS